MDSELARQIGELIGEVRGINRRLDQFLDEHSDLAERVRKLENALAWVKGVSWVATGLGTVALTLGAAAIRFLT